jgi:hypothetical protein
MYPTYLQATYWLLPLSCCKIESKRCENAFTVVSLSHTVVISVVFSSVCINASTSFCSVNAADLISVFFIIVALISALLTFPHISLAESSISAGVFATCVLVVDHVLISPVVALSPVVIVFTISSGTISPLMLSPISHVFCSIDGTTDVGATGLLSLINLYPKNNNHRRHTPPNQTNNFFCFPLLHANIAFNHSTGVCLVVCSSAICALAAIAGLSTIKLSKSIHCVTSSATFSKIGFSGLLVICGTVS